MYRDVLDAPELRPFQARPRGRSLGSNDQSSFQSLLVDKRGREYDPYSLSWRYLGLYLDCDMSDVDNGWYYPRRRLPSNDEGGECERKVLWAAYVDTRYKGNAIEEYAFYDLQTKEWDDTACRASGKRHRCARMDCHERNTHWKLVGVFKETDGMYDFTEQLFKHEGYCVWGNDGDGEDSTYETMETWMEKWPTSCTQLQNQDFYGNTLYIHVHPLPEGNMTLEIYDDDACTSISPYVDLTIYIETLYYNYYGSYDQGTKVAEMYQQAIETWNEKMSVFKTCQPCRAYNLFSENGNDHSQDHRRLGSGDDNDGEGEEQERYNCYDDAGYTNVNQCYKFETKTSMEVAEPEDLALASSQGSVLRIKAYGKRYGKGGYSSPMSAGRLAANVMLGVAAATCLAAAVVLFQRRLAGKKWKDVPEMLQESFNTGADDAEMGKGNDAKNADDMSCTSASTRVDRNGTYDASEIKIGIVPTRSAGEENTTRPDESDPVTSPGSVLELSASTKQASSSSAALLAELGLFIDACERSLEKGPPAVEEKAAHSTPSNEASERNDPNRKASRMDTAVLLDLGLVKRSKIPPYAPPVAMQCPEPDALAASASLETTPPAVDPDCEEATAECQEATESPYDLEATKSLDDIEAGFEAVEVGLVDTASNSTASSVPDSIQSLATSESSMVEPSPATVDDAAAAVLESIESPVTNDSSVIGPSSSTVDDAASQPKEADRTLDHIVASPKEASRKTNEDTDANVGTDASIPCEEAAGPSDITTKSADGIAESTECNAETTETEVADESNSEHVTSVAASDDRSRSAEEAQARARRWKTTMTVVPLRTSNRSTRLMSPRTPNRAQLCHPWRVRRTRSWPSNNAAGRARQLHCTLRSFAETKCVTSRLRRS